MDIENERYFFRIESELPISAEQLWWQVGSLSAVNSELFPISMSSASAYRNIHLKEAPVGKFLFRSIVLLFGFIPLDVHRFYLESIGPKFEFKERSSSLFNQYWRHHRKILEIEEDSCLLIDEIAFKNRLGFLSGIFKGVYRKVFNRRHAYLRKKFASGRTSPGRMNEI